MVEVYCEEVKDLLEDGCPEVRVREDPKRGVYVEGREDCVTEEDEAVELIGRGQARRAVGSTDMNARSSRSHTIIRIVVESRPKEKEGDGDGGEEETGAAITPAGKSKAAGNRTTPGSASTGTSGP